MEKFALGIDLGGTRVKHVLVSESGQTVDQGAHDFKQHEAMDWKSSIQYMVRQIQDRFPDHPLSIGLSAPGLVALDGLSIRHMPGRLQGLEGLVWTEALNHPAPIPVLNDAHSALLGEVWRGVARGMQNVVMITLGTGVGGAAMVDGHLLKGHIGRAGHLGHISQQVYGPPDICRTPGSLEWNIGNCTIKDRTNGRFTSTHDLVQASIEGDPFAKGVWERSVRYLAAGLTSFINILDPEAIVIGGGIAESGRTLFEPLQKALNEMEWHVQDHRVSILKASLGEYAGAYGAAFQSLENQQIGT
jgi:glucokinase